MLEHSFQHQTWNYGGELRRKAQGVQINLNRFYPKGAPHTPETVSRGIVSASQYCLRETQQSRVSATPLLGCSSKFLLCGTTSGSGQRTQSLCETLSGNGFPQKGTVACIAANAAQTDSTRGRDSNAQSSATLKSVGGSMITVSTNNNLLAMPRRCTRVSCTRHQTAIGSTNAVHENLSASK